MAEVTSPPWLNVRRGNAPLLLVPCRTRARRSPANPWSPLVFARRVARREKRLVRWTGCTSFAERLDASLVRTGISRSVIDPNRDPSGVSLYPGQATTGL